VEIGLVPTLDLKKITGTPLTIAAPTWVTVGPTSYWNRGVTGCGVAITTPCSLSNAGGGLALKETLDWLVPTRWGNWYAKGGFQYYHIINDSLLLAQTFTGTASSYPTAHREVWVVCGLGLHVLSTHMNPARDSEIGTSGFCLKPPGGR
jgi:hypothetical protein